MAETADYIPGLQPSSVQDGNLSDIANAGSLHEFLLHLHQKFGPIASFWIHKLYVVSIASAKLFEEHQHTFDRPPELFETLKPLLGEKSIQFANGQEGQTRRRYYDDILNGDAVKQLFPQIQKIADETAKKCESKVNQQCVSLQQIRSMFSLKSLLNVIFGDSVTDEETVLAFKKAYDVTNSELELRLIQPPTDERETTFQQCYDCFYFLNQNQSSRYLKESIKRLIDNRKASPPTSGRETILDDLMSYSDDAERQLDDAVTFTVGGFHNNCTALHILQKYFTINQKQSEQRSE